MIKYYYYAAYGLIIKSRIKLPALMSKKSNHNVNIHFDKLDSFSDYFVEHILENNLKLQINEKNTCILWKNHRICAITSQEIIINQSLATQESFLREIIQYHAIPILLNKRNRLMLHANSVNMNGKGIILMGPKGIGKSTISISLQKKGYNIISDDISSIGISPNHIIKVFPSYFQVKLGSDIIKHFGEDPEKMPKVRAKINKHIYINKNNFSNSSELVESIYLIENSSNETCIEPISNQKSVMELINSTIFGKIFDKQQQIENLYQCTEIVKKIPVKNLKIKRSLNDLNTIVETIENDIFK